MNHSRNSGNTQSETNNQKTKQRTKKEQRKAYLVILLALLPLLVISGLALSAYLSRPPELPPQEEDKQGGITERLTEETNEAGTEDTANQETGENQEPGKQAKQYKDNFYTFVLTGSDYEGFHTDTIMVISLDAAAKKVNLISIPRDSQVDVPGDYKKINAAYANGGTKELKKQLESILGFAPQYAIRIDLKAFPKLVDAVGGVEFDVPQDMVYVDITQNLNINLVKGHQLLDGEKALQLVRFRGYPSADLGRMDTQQKFLKALAKKVLSPANILKINTFISIFQQDVKTDMGLRDLQWFAQQVVKLNPNTDISVQTLPYTDDGNYLGQNYLFLSPLGVLDMVNRTVNPYTTAITLNDVNIIRIEDNQMEKPDYGMVRNNILLL